MFAMHPSFHCRASSPLCACNAQQRILRFHVVIVSARTPPSPDDIAVKEEPSVARGGGLRYEYTHNTQTHGGEENPKERQSSCTYADMRFEHSYTPPEQENAINGRETTMHFEFYRTYVGNGLNNPTGVIAFPDIEPCVRRLICIYPSHKRCVRSSSHIKSLSYSNYVIEIGKIARRSRNISRKFNHLDACRPSSPMTAAPPPPVPENDLRSCML